MENIHLIFKFLWYSVLFCIWGVSCTSSGTYKKTQMDIYMQYYDFIIDSLSKNPSYVCTRTARQMSVATDSVAYYHYLVLLAKAYMFKSEMDSAKLSMDRVSIRPRACFSPSYNKVKSQTCFVWLLTLL